MLTPIKLRINHMLAQTPFDDAFLLPDVPYAISMNDGSAYLMAVVPFSYDGLYAQNGPSFLIANISVHTPPNDIAYALILYGMLTERTALDLYMGPFADDERVPLLIDIPADEDYEFPEYDDYGRPEPDEFDAESNET